MSKIIPKHVKSIHIIPLIIFGVILLFTGPASGDVPKNLPGYGALIPPFSIPAPPKQADKSYLMLDSESRFKPANLKVKLLLIEVFNFYCASCQFMMPYMNELYTKIEQDPELKGQVKMIGIGAGNDHWDIELEEDSYKFPIVPDKDYKFHNLVGQPATPFLIFAKPYTQGRLLVVNSYLGRLEDSDKLLSMTRAAFNTDISKINIALKEKQYNKEKAELVIPISKDDLMKKVRDLLSEGGKKLLSVKKIDLADLGSIYIGTLENSKEPIFARVVARKIPCGDCHDVFYIYSFNAKGEFKDFIPIAISKLGNEEWDEDDLNKIRRRFKNTSLLNKIPYNAEIDAVTAATISTKLIYDSLGETNLVIEKLIDLGYIPPQK